MVTSLNLGFPRLGAFRELKTAVESYWKGTINKLELLDTAKKLRATHWKLQQDAGIDLIPVGDFSFYDHVLDTATMLGAVPARYQWKGENVDLDTYFAMARGHQSQGLDVVAMEMTKWFDTNYHYIVPELSSKTKFKLSTNRLFDQIAEAQALGVNAKPVILGPVSFLLLAKSTEEGLNTLDLLPKLLPVYKEILEKIAATGVTWVQIDEPCLVMDISEEARRAYTEAYTALAGAKKGLNILLATYFGALKDNMATAFNLPVEAVHIDLVRAPEQLNAALAQIPETKALSLGVVDGRNIWRANLSEAFKPVKQAVDALGADRVFVGASCSLLHSPVDLDNETKLDAELKSWMAFAKQKLQEIAALANAANGKKDAAIFAASDAAAEARANSPRVHNVEVKARVKNITAEMVNRASAYPQRAVAQAKAHKLPALPTTTIGSFPQTAEVRSARASFKKGTITQAQYDEFLKKETEKCIREQEAIGIDVLVHGEFERNDMVEYFGEQLSGFVFTQNGWVQSYGSRGVKPPVIFGDVSRPAPMTVEWSSYAQSLTKKPMKGMLTGPVTILQWSFVRNDQPRSDTCRQIALAIRDEVKDLESAGITIIQIDEPAVREGLPLRNADKKSYLNWAVESFRISASGIADTTQIHTHMCYCEFNDIMDSIAAMDADVISIETSRSAMELLDAFVDFKYPNEVGPGVYDIHSPRVPKTEEMEHLLHKALKVLKTEQVWVNPDCGLKTRGWPETKAALENMVAAAKHVRAALGLKDAA